MLIEFGNLVSALGDQLYQTSGMRSDIAEHLFGDAPDPADDLPDNIQRVGHTRDDPPDYGHLFLILRERPNLIGQLTEAAGHVKQLLSGLRWEYLLEFLPDQADDVLDRMHDVPEAGDQLIPAAQFLPLFDDLVSRLSRFADDLAEEIADTRQKLLGFLKVADDIPPGLGPSGLCGFLQRVKQLGKGFNLCGSVRCILRQPDHFVRFLRRKALRQQFAALQLLHGLDAFFHVLLGVPGLFGHLLKVPGELIQRSCQNIGSEPSLLQRFLEAHFIYNFLNGLLNDFLDLLTILAYFFHGHVNGLSHGLGVSENGFLEYFTAHARAHDTIPLISGNCAGAHGLGKHIHGVAGLLGV